MANTKSAIKAARQAGRHAIRNKATHSRLKSLRKNYDEAVAKGDAATARATGVALAAASDKAVKRGVIHRNAANHAKSHVAKHTLAKA